MPLSDGTGTVTAFGGPHNPCSNDNYTPAGQAACDEAVNPQASSPPCGGELELSPETLTVSGCSREVEKHAFTIENGTGTAVTVDLMYNIISGEGTCGGPSSFGPVDVSGSAQFTIYLYPDCAPGGTVVCEVTAQAGSFSDTATISTQCVSGSGWTPVSTEPESGRLDNVVAAYNNLIWSLAGYGSSANVHNHASQYLTPIAEAAFGAGTPQAQQWLTQTRSDLWDGRIQELLQACRTCLRPAASRPFAEEAISYYTHNEKRMDYARFRHQGYLIGRGTIESACKQIAAARLKCSGARWTLPGVIATAKARAAWLSKSWDSLKPLYFQLSQAA